VNCPKCGYLQEERLDCRKCGVVFSKYYALHNQEKTLQSDSREASSPQPHVPSSETYLPDLVEIRQNLKEVARRLNETEFERAERVRLSGEIRSLDQKIQDLQAQFASSIEGLEEKAESLVASAFPSEDHLRKLNVELIETYLDPFLKRLDQVEKKAEKKQNANSRDPEGDDHFQNLLRGLEQRMAALEKPEPRGADSAEQQSGGMLDQEKILNEFDEIRLSLQNVTLKYSEIGELKKNHLVLMSKIETIQQEVDASKMESSGALSTKIPELETEVHALRAEVRQALGRLETLESSPLQSAQSMQFFEQEIGSLRETQAKEPQRTQAAIAGLETSLTEKLSSVMGLSEDLKWISQRCQSLEESFARAGRDLNEAGKKIAELDSGIAGVVGEAQQLRTEQAAHAERLDMIMSHAFPEPKSSTEEDVRAIRDDIHRMLEMVVKPVAGSPGSLSEY
jgi:chromosome segregation ATPase